MELFYGYCILLSTSYIFAFLMFKLLTNVNTFSNSKMQKKLLSINLWLTFNIVFKTGVDKQP